MKIHWMLAVLLSSAVAVGCGDRSTDSAQNLEENTTPPAATVPVPEAPAAVAPAPSRRDDSTVRDSRPATSGARPTTGREPAPQFREVTLPAGTALPLELITAVSSETAQIETPVSARLRQAVVMDGYTALPAGAVLSGHVTDVDRAGRVRGRSRLAFRFTEVQVGGAPEDLRTNPIAFEGEASKGEDATKIGAGAVGGAIVGGIVGGAEGAAKGAAIGGAAGTGVVLATRGREVTLASGTDIAATLAEPFTIRAQVR